MTPCGYQQFAAGAVDTAQSLTLPNAPQQPTFAIITPITQGIRWRDDGTAPSATVGMPVAAGTTIFYDGALKNLQIIASTAGAEVNISYYYGVRYA